MFYPRHILPRIREALEWSPVVAVLGARQVGKSTLVAELVEGGWEAGTHSLDDFALLEAAHRDPDGFVDQLELPAALDEVQRAPDLLRSVKRAVDRDRRPGQFVLTGSANLLTMKAVSESLAGRVALFEVLPLSLGELLRCPTPSRFLDALFEAEDARGLLARLSVPGERLTRPDYPARILAGGLPVPVDLLHDRARGQWFTDYRQTYLERDLREIARVADLPSFSRLVTLVAARTGEPLNVSRLSRDLGLPVTTVRRYLGLLETTYQVFTVPSHSVNVGKRMVKAPRLLFTDTGMASHLAASADWELLERQGRVGAMVETWVAGELRKLSSLASSPTELCWWRTHDGAEVDLLLVRGTRLAAIEIKWTSSPSAADFRGIERCRALLGEDVGLGVVLHSGDHAVAFGPHDAAIPFDLALGGGWG